MQLPPTDSTGSSMALRIRNFITPIIELARTPA
jgi:hypothetical protein